MESVAAASDGSGLQIWGFGSFENDAAVSWVETLEDADDLQMVEETLEEVLAADERGDIPGPGESARAIAAAETVAALSEQPAKSLPEEIRQWCFDNPSVDLDEAQPKAMHALGVILNQSGLREVLEDNGIADDWENEVEELRDRLRAG